MKTFLFIPLALALTACSLQDTTVNNTRTVIGGGNELGWQIHLQQINKQTYSFDFENGYGKEKHKGRALLANNQEDIRQFVGKTEDGKALVVTVTNQSCTDDADKSYDNQITVEFNEKILNGCGSSNW